MLANDQVTEIHTDIPGINEPGADRMLTRMLSDAWNLRRYWLREADSALGEGCKSFAKEMAGSILDIIAEINTRIQMLIIHYEERISELNAYCQEADIADVNDILNVEHRIRMRLDYLKRTIENA